MRFRERKRIALLTAIAIVFTLNAPVFAEEIKADFGEEASIDEIKENTYESGIDEFQLFSDDATQKSYAGWNVKHTDSLNITEGEDKYTGKELFLEPQKYYFNKDIDDESRKIVYTRHVRDSVVSLNGSLGSEDIYLSINSIIENQYGNALHIHVALDYPDQTDKVRVYLSENSYADKYENEDYTYEGDFDSYTNESRELLTEDEFSHEYTNGKYRYLIGIKEKRNSEGEIIATDRRGIAGGAVHISTDPGVAYEGGSEVLYKVPRLLHDGRIWYDEVKRSYIEFYNEKQELLSYNQPAVPVNKMVGEYNIKYYTNIPYFGKTINKWHYNDVLGEIEITDAEHNVYTVEKAKVVRLKNVSPDQGPFPTVSNAAIQITKVYLKEHKGNGDSSKTLKETQKKLKKLTKVNKKGAENIQALPIIIYPYRLDADDGNYHFGRSYPYLESSLILSGKPGKYSVKFNNPFDPKKSDGYKQFNVKNGKKDSFKTGKHIVEYDASKKLLTVSGADFWSGFNGVSSNKITFSKNFKK